jgi:hypothetical protein
MGYGAIIGAVASLVASGVSAYSSSQKGKGAGGVPKVNLSTVSLPDAANTGLGEYATQQAGLPGLETTASQADAMSNEEFQKMLTSVDPDLMRQITQIGSIASSYLNGIIPQDVQDQIQRDTAQQAMTGGYAGTQMARNLTSRDLGLTSLDLQQKGMAASQTAANMARGVNPSFTPISQLLFTPSQLLARKDQLTYYNNDIKNQQAVMNSGNQLAAQMYAAKMQSQGSAATSTAVNQGINTLFGSSSSSSSSGGLLGGIMKLFSQSGSGGGGGFNFGDASTGGGQTVGAFTDAGGGTAGASGFDWAAGV